VVAMWNSNWGWPFRIPFAVIDAYHQRADSNWLDTGRLPRARIGARRAGDASAEGIKGVGKA
jgi:beta-lactamase class C